LKTAEQLATELNICPSYIQEIVRRFRKQGMIIPSIKRSKMRQRTDLIALEELRLSNPELFAQR
jgi:hypothetical protein